MVIKPYPFQEVWIRLEEGRTLYSERKISCAGAAVDVMAEEMSRYDREVVCIVNLNNANQPINFNIVSMGTLNASLVDASNVLKSSILSNAGSFIMLHNHPSGDLFPSDADREATWRMILAGNLMGIPCIDHVIIAGGRKEIYSMREHKDLDFAPEYDRMITGAKSMAREEKNVYETPFGDVDEEAARASFAGREREPHGEELTIKFGKGLCQFFTSKKGTELARVRIPDTPYESWPSFVVPAKIVHDNRYGKGFWMKLPSDGKTMLSISKRIVRADGSEGWDTRELQISNTQLKEMVESYKRDAKEKSTPEGPAPYRIRGQRR